MPVARARRLLRAADIAFELGRPHLVARFLDEAEGLPLEAPDRAKASWQRELLSDARGFGTVDLEGIVELLDGEPALDALLIVVSRGWMTGLDAQRRARIVAAAERLAPAPDDARLLLLLAMVDPVSRGAFVLEQLRGLAPASIGDPETLRQLGIAASIVGDPVRASAFLGGAIRGLRVQGRLGLLADALVAQAWIAWQLGTWRMAASLADEAQRLAIETRRPGVIFGAPDRPGRRRRRPRRGGGGGADRARRRALAALGPALRAEHAGDVRARTRGRGRRAPGRRLRASAADLHRRRQRVPPELLPDRHRGVRRRRRPERPCRRSARGRARTRSAVGTDRDTGTLRAGLIYARPLLADDGHADAAFAGPTRRTSSRGRSASALAWSSRTEPGCAGASGCRESRAPLRAARDALDAIGAGPWAERARQELRASGEGEPRRAPAGRARRADAAGAADRDGSPPTG